MAKGNGITPVTDHADAALLELREHRHRADSWYNQRSRFGGSGDSVISSGFVRNRERIKRAEAEALYEFDWLSGRVVDQMAHDATREWVRLTHSTDSNKAEKLREEDQRLGGQAVFEEGIRLSRLHGGNLIVLGAWDGNAPEEPLKVERVKKVVWTANVDRWLSFPVDWYRDIEEEKYGTPETYRIHRLAVVGTHVALVHETRCIRLDGNPLPPLARVRNWNWGASVLDKVYDALRNWGMSNQAAASIIPSFITYAMKIENLQQLIANGQWATISARVGEAFATMATQNMMTYGQGEEIQKMGTPVSGLPDLIDRFMNIVSGAVGIPKSILFQSESGGLGGTASQTDRDNWFDTVASYQETYLKQKVRYWLDVIGVPLGIKPGEVEFEFVSLKQQSPDQEASLYLKNAQGDQIYLNAQVVHPEAVAVHRFGGDKYNPAPLVVDTEREEKVLELLKKQKVELGAMDQQRIAFSGDPEGGFPGGPGGGDFGGGGQGGPGGPGQDQDQEPGFDTRDALDAEYEDVTDEEAEDLAWYRAEQAKLDAAKGHVGKPGSRGGHIIGYKSGEPVYGNPKLKTAHKIESLPTSGPKVGLVKQLLAETAQWGDARQRIAERAAHGYRHPGSTVYTARDAKGGMAGIAQLSHRSGHGVHLEFMASAPNAKGAGRELLRTAAHHAMSAGEDLTWESTKGSDPYYRNAVGAVPDEADFGPDSNNLYRVPKDQLGLLVHQGSLHKEVLKGDVADGEDLTVGGSEHATARVQVVTARRRADGTLEATISEQDAPTPEPADPVDEEGDEKKDGDVPDEGGDLRVDVSNPKHVQHPGSRGGHIIGYLHGEPIYGKPGTKLPHGATETKHATQHAALPGSLASHPNVYHPSAVMHEQLSGPKGTNLGGIFKSKGGVERYVKHYTDPAQSYGEDLSARVYRALGIGAPETFVLRDPDDPGKVSFASNMLTGGKLLKEVPLTQHLARTVLKGLAADVLLANWDSVGLEHDNIMVSEDGGVSRIDNGGSLLFRAKAGRKPETALLNVTEWESLADPKKNPAYAKVFKAAGITDADELGQEALTQIAAIKLLREKTNNFNDMISSSTSPGLSLEDKGKIITMLSARAEYLIGVVAPRIEAKLKGGGEFTHAAAVAGGQASHSGGGGQAGPPNLADAPPGPWHNPSTFEHKVYQALLTAPGGMSGGQLAKHDWWAHKPKTVWPYAAANKLVAAGLAVKVGPKYILKGAGPDAADVKPTLPNASDVKKFKNLNGLLKHYAQVKAQVFPHYSEEEANAWTTSVFQPAVSALNAKSQKSAGYEAAKKTLFGMTTSATQEHVNQLYDDALKELPNGEVTSKLELEFVAQVLNEQGHSVASDASYKANLLAEVLAKQGFTPEAVSTSGKQLKYQAPLAHTYVAWAKDKVYKLLAINTTKELEAAGQAVVNQTALSAAHELPDGEFVSVMKLTALAQEMALSFGLQSAFTLNAQKKLNDLGFTHEAASAGGKASHGGGALPGSKGPLPTPTQIEANAAADVIKAADNVKGKNMEDEIAKLVLQGGLTPGVLVAMLDAFKVMAYPNNIGIVQKRLFELGYDVADVDFTNLSHAAWAYSKAGHTAWAYSKAGGGVGAGGAMQDPDKPTVEEKKNAKANYEAFLTSGASLSDAVKYNLQKFHTTTTSGYLVALHDIAVAQYNYTTASVIAEELATKGFDVTGLGEDLPLASQELYAKITMMYAKAAQGAGGAPPAPAPEQPVGKKLPTVYYSHHHHADKMMAYMANHYAGYGMDSAGKVKKYAAGIGKKKSPGSWLALHGKLLESGKHNSAGAVAQVLANKGYDVSSLGSTAQSAQQSASTYKPTAPTEKPATSYKPPPKEVVPLPLNTQTGKPLPTKKYAVPFYEQGQGALTLEPEVPTKTAAKKYLLSKAPDPLDNATAHQELKAAQGWWKGLSSDAQSRIHHYMGSGSGHIVAAGYKGQVNSSSYKALHQFEGDLLDAPIWTGPMFRLMRLDEEAYKDLMTDVAAKGKIVNKSVQSFSRDFGHTLTTHVHTGNHFVYYVLDKSKSGRIIGTEAGAGEQEVIAMRGTRYTVRDHLETYEEGRVTTYIYLSEDT